jgi:hypothetical protein
LHNYSPKKLGFYYTTPILPNTVKPCPQKSTTKFTSRQSRLGIIFWAMNIPKNIDAFRMYILSISG